MQRLILAILFFLSIRIYASHIVGGEITYECLGNDDYKITLKLYRDCYTSQVPFDNPAYLFIFDAQGKHLNTLSVGIFSSRVLPVEFKNPCFQSPPNTCVAEAVYQLVTKLPPINGGYDISYQRCCRNNMINVISSRYVGSTYTVHIPGKDQADCNNSPVFNNFPPQFLCAGLALSFDHAAIDSDGDSLVYELCDPFSGADSVCPAPGPTLSNLITGCPEAGSPPPYNPVRWKAPYNGSYPVNSSPPLAIDPITGLLRGVPDMIGLWVVGVCVKEYRDGVLLGVHSRDFQFNVLNCPSNTSAAFFSEQKSCAGYQVDFINESKNANSFYWDFGDPASSSDTSSLSTPSYTYSDSGTYLVTLIANPKMICSDTLVLKLTLDPKLDPKILPLEDQCLDGNSFDFHPGGSFSGTGAFYWDFGPHALPSSSLIKDPTNIVFDSVGEFIVKLTIEENGCTAICVDTVRIQSIPEANFNFPTQKGCSPLQIAIDEDVVSSNGLVTQYWWDFGDGESSKEKSPSHTYLNSGSYDISLTIEVDNGCSDTLSFLAAQSVLVYASPVADFDAVPNETSIIDPNIQIVDKSYNRTECYMLFGDGDSSATCTVEHIYTDTGIFKITQIVSNYFGCSDTITKIIKINYEESFWLPNSFTPNNDGLNDVFIPVISPGKDFTLFIYDRWGELIFETKNIDQGWNGQVNGVGGPAADGVYVYKISLFPSSEDNVDAREEYHIGKVLLTR